LETTPARTAFGLKLNRAAGYSRYMPALAGEAAKDIAARTTPDQQAILFLEAEIGDEFGTLGEGSSISFFRPGSG